MTEDHICARQERLADHCPGPEPLVIVAGPVGRRAPGNPLPLKADPLVGSVETVHLEVRVSLFDDLLAEATAGSRLDHRAHVHLTWLAVRQTGMPAAVNLVSEGIQRTARYAGVPQKYHATLSRAWVELVAHHVEARPANNFDDFARNNSELLDKRLVSRFYRSTTLAGQAARTGWVEPDLAPFPWLAPGSDAHPSEPG